MDVNLWKEYGKEIMVEDIAFAFDNTACIPFYLKDNPIKQFVEKHFTADKVRLYDATLFLMMSCTNEGFWKMLQMMDETIILIANDITIENIEKSKKIFKINTAFNEIVGYPVYGNVILIAKKYLPKDLVDKVQKLEDRMDPLF